MLKTISHLAIQAEHEVPMKDNTGEQSIKCSVLTKPELEFLKWLPLNYDDLYNRINQPRGNVFPRGVFGIASVYL